MSAGQKGLRKIRLLPPSKENPRNSEGSIIELKDGRLFLAYSRFYGGENDNSAACIAGRFSEDKGRTWSKKDITVVENEGKENVMSVSLLRLRSGGIALFYTLKNSWSDCRLYMRKSSDETQSWSDKKLCIPTEGYYVVINDRVTELSSGRLIVPAALHPCSDGTQKTWSRRGKLEFFYSDDEGQTWQRSKTILESPVPDGEDLARFGIKGTGEWLAPLKHASGLQEPGIVELKDGSLLLWARTDLGCQYISRSFDQGLTWSRPEPSELVSPCSPATIKRIPQSGDLLVIYNDHSGRFPYQPGKRTPLCSAISRDGGKTWGNHKIIEDDPDGWYCYTSCTFVDDMAVLSYCAGNSKIGGLNLLQITLISIDWFYR